MLEACSGHLDPEPGLAHPTGADQSHEPVFGQDRHNVGDRLLASDEARQGRGQDVGGFEQQGVVLQQDPQLELLELRRGIHPQFVGEGVAELPERAKGLDLPAGPVERQHAQGVQPLVIRVEVAEQPQLRQHVVVPTKAHLRCDPRLGALELDLLEPLCLDPYQVTVVG